jgi:hypothetical protein
VRRSPGLLFLAPAALLAAACAAPLRDGRACSGAGACEQGRTCVVGRCRPQDTPPSPADALRVVLAPADLAVVASGASGGGGDDLPDTVALGRASSGTVVMLFRFVPSWQDEAEILSAFLVIHPLDDAPPAAAPIAFEMARIVEPWRADTTSWGRQPRLTVPITAGAVQARPTLPVRVDVTPLVRDWAKRKRDDHGIALLARGDDAFGTPCSLGIARGAGPRLEVYVR